MKIGIIGAGQNGGTLARRLSQLAHQVSVANSRGPESLSGLARETGAKPVSARQAARSADIEDGMIESRWVSHYLGRPVVKAFHNIDYRHLAANGRSAGTPGASLCQSLERIGMPSRPSSVC